MSKLYIVAGEMSGDIHAAEMLSALSRRRKKLEICGLGGKEMATLSERIENWTDNSAVMGVVEVMKHYSFFKKKFQQSLEEIEKIKPDLLVLVDYPGFNLRLAKAAHERWPQLKKAYYISPQVWAWHRGRIPAMVKMLDLMLCLFPFEKELFRQAGLRSEWVGHPLVDELEAKRIKTERKEGLVGFFPGSREREVSGLFPMMIRCAKKLQRRLPKLRFQSAAATEKLEELMKHMLKQNGAEDLITIGVGNSQTLMQRAEAGVIASGTATLEATYYQMPHCLVYKLAPVTYLLGKLLVRVKDIGIANILAGHRIVPEFIQREAEPHMVVPFLESILKNPKHRQEQLNHLKKTASLLGEEGAHERAAKALESLLNEQP